MPDTPSMKTSPWAIPANAALGSLVVAVGFWLMWGELPALVVALLALAAALFLHWVASSIARVWAWATLLLGVESLAWPVATMIRARLESAEPTEQRMGEILTSLLFGLFSAIFWTSFAYGIFTWARRQEAGAGEQAPAASRGASKPKRRAER